MQTMMCTRCGKNIAIVFVRKIENGTATNEGLCLKCAREIGIRPMNDVMKFLGITEEEVDSMTSEMMEVISSPEELKGLLDIEGDDSLDDEGKTATFPFLNRFFGGAAPEPPAVPPQEGQRQQREGTVPREGAVPREGTGPREGRDGGAPKRKFLENYCLCLTRRAKEGKLDRVIGRGDEIQRVIQILNRRQKNNPCLIGEPGVGKTAIAEGLAQAISDGEVPFKLRDKEVYLLDLTALVAGTQFRGQFESRMKGLIEEIRRLGNIILVIDEVHSLVGAGDAEGSMNAANILKPALSRGEVQVIGATTFSEYRKHIEKDAALERRFQPVTVAEPSVDESVEIIKGIAPYYERFHGVRIPDETARQAVLLSERYITDRFLPDKAIDLIDEACSDLNLKTPAIHEVEAVKKELDDVRASRETLMADTAAGTYYEKLAALKSRELRLGEKLGAYSDSIAPELSVENLARVIEQWTKIPASRVREQEFSRLAGLEERLKKRLVGQDGAVEAVSAAIRRGRAGVSAKRKPISFIFTGPTGVGKTELVKCLAQDLFDAPESLIRLDMSEFMEKHAVSRIIGAPPGYVGYDEAGQLTEKVRRKPYCVILFDEIEKAHPDVLNVLLQILDDGHVTDAHGRKVNFENTVVIMTSNAGSDKNSAPVGYAGGVAEQSREKMLKALNDFLRPEFINRVDEVVAFNPLGREQFRAIAALMLKELADNLLERGLHFTWDGDALTMLAEKSFSQKYGARNLRRLIQKEIEDAVAGLVIGGYQNPVTHMKAVVRDGAVTVVGL
ncbi:MAG: ATP-dependent Clp protease ATP-binding subunit [Oscillospiraceae bacterium]|jgi:ATP-dependent Clp protease ATP-binding subunit ClpA|nr:ATP-dependent Clp protease ATP-binding subunit [Oscillospiraceae bacterium]